MSSSDTPPTDPRSALSGLASALLADPGLRTVVDAAGRDAAVEGPTALRPLLAAALAADPHGERGGAGRTALLVCATEREAEELAERDR